MNNEQQHGKWYENNTDDALIMDWMFQEVNVRAPLTPLFLNDFNIVSNGVATQVCYGIRVSRSSA